MEPPAAVTGAVRVANEVIASIAAMAAREIDGVADLDEQAAHQFGDWLRGMVRFDSIDDLVAQMGRDVEEVRRRLRAESP